MRKGSILFYGLLAGVILGLGSGWWVFGAEEGKDWIRTRLLRWEEADQVTGDWGKMRVYLTGDSRESKEIFSGLAELKPGEALHPAHRHLGDEFLLVTEGTGEWHIEGETKPAKEGDLLYVEPWKMHGLRNTGEKPLKFFVVKWQSKGVEPPPEPEGSHGR